MNIAHSLVVGLLPALLWLFFWLKEDNLHPEPRSAIAKTFLGGILVVFFAIFLEKIAADIIYDEKIKYIVWAAIEEISKFLVVGVIAVTSIDLDEPIDAMIYFITAALGFAALENIMYVASAIDSGHLLSGVVTGNMRFIGATLLHIISSAVIGFMMGLAFYKNSLMRILYVTVGVILAIALHALFNLSIINETVTNTLKIFGLVWVGVVVLLILFEEIKEVKPVIKNKRSTS